MLVQGRAPVLRPRQPVARRTAASSPAIPVLGGDRGLPDRVPGLNTRRNDRTQATMHISSFDVGILPSSGPPMPLGGWPIEGLVPALIDLHDFRVRSAARAARWAAGVGSS